MGIGFVRIAHFVGWTDAEFVESMDRLVEHGLIACFAVGSFRGPDQVLFRKSGVRTGGLASVLVFGQRGDGKKRANVAVPLSQRRQSEFLKLSHQTTGMPQWCLLCGCAKTR